jgi:hypothetical protein
MPYSVRIRSGPTPIRFAPWRSGIPLQLFFCGASRRRSCIAGRRFARKGRLPVGQGSHSAGRNSSSIIRSSKVFAHADVVVERTGNPLLQSPSRLFGKGSEGLKGARLGEDACPPLRGPGRCIVSRHRSHDDGVGCRPGRIFLYAKCVESVYTTAIPRLKEVVPCQNS